MALGPTESVVVTGVGLVSALGNEAPTTWQRLLANESAIALRQPFLELPPGPLAMIGKTPVAVKALVETTVLAALADAQLSSPLPDCGVVIGSSRSHQGEWEALARQRSGQTKSADPLKTNQNFWLGTLPHQAALRAAQQVGSGGPVLAPMAACATGIWALAQGVELIRTGQCDRVIAGAVEAPITPLTLAGFAKMGAQAQTGCYPFDEAREGLVLGEGAAVMLLERATLAAQRGVPVYGEIRGFGLLNDAHHITSPAAHTAIAAVRQCLQRSQLTPADIDFIHTHGTATQRNDQMEAAIAATVFPKNIAITATKGATGHTLGASGAMGTVFSLLALRHQQLPPCVGLKTPAFDLNFVRQSQTAPLRHGLCCSFGFGGQNTLVCLSRAASMP
ncbi:MAG: beta-ketoacyl-ACP synthase [Cyanobacteria bacterium P01_D01_bin.44]